MNLKKILQHVFAFVFLLSILHSCNTATQRKAPPNIFPPIPALQPSASVFDVNATLGDTIEIESGTQIIVPAEAFVDSVGNIVKGIIKLSYLELHNTLDIMLAGVPMEYDSLNNKGYMQTAGMFEIKARQGTQNLELADAKTVKVQMASYQTGSDYNFYSFDNDSANWVYEGTAPPEENKNIATIQTNISKLESQPSFPFGKDYFVFQLGTALDLYFNNNWKRINKSNTKFMAKKLDEYGMDYVDINANASFKIWGRYYYASEILWKKEGGVKLPSWVKMNNAYVFEAKPKGGKMYRIGIQESDWRKKNRKKVYITAKAHLPLQRVLKRKPDAWQEAYASIQEEIKLEQKRLATEALVFRTYEVKKMGWCNWDRIQTRYNTIQLAANFTWPNMDKETDMQRVVYYFVDNQSSYIRVREEDWPSISLSQDKSAFFMAVVGADSIAVFDNKQYAKINFSQLKNQEAPQLDLPMKLYVTEGKNGLKQLLETFKTEESR